MRTWKYWARRNLHPGAQEALRARAWRIRQKRAEKRGLCKEAVLCERDAGVVVRFLAAMRKRLAA